MHKKTPIAAIILALSLALSVGCAKDPMVERQKALDAGKKAMEEKKYREAIFHFTRATKIDSTWIDARYHLATAAIRAVDFRVAKQALDATLELDPKHVDAQRDLASLWYAARQYGEARKAADKLLTMKPKDSRGMELRAYSIAAEAANMDAAEKELTELVANDPGSLSAAYNYAKLRLQRSGDASKAEEVVRAVLEKKPDAQGYGLLAGLLAMQDRIPDADAAYQKALELEPKLHSVRRELARHYETTGRLDLAEKEYAVYVAGDPEPASSRTSLASFRLRRGRAPQAVADYEQLFKKYPAERAIRSQLVAALLTVKNEPRARAVIEDALKANAQDSSALIFKTFFLLHDNQVDAALEAAQKVLQFEPNSSTALFYKGVCHLRRNERAAAGDAFGASIKSLPANLFARMALAQLNLEGGPAAVQAALTLSKEAPPPQDASEGMVLIRVVALIRQGQRREAEEMLKRLLAGGVKGSGFQSVWGMLMLEKGQAKEALAAYQKALAIDPNDVSATYGLVRAFMALKQPEAGRVDFEKRVQVNPKFGPAIIGLAQLQIATGKIPDGEQTLKRYTAQNPKDIDAFLAQAQLRAQAGDLTGAEAAVRGALQSWPGDPRLLAILGSNLLVQNRLPDAEKTLREALSRDPDNQLAANNLAYLLVENGGNIDEALKFAEQSKERAPNDPAVNDTLGWIYVKKNNFSRAVALLQDSVSKDPKNASYLYHLGVAQWRAGKVRQAETSLRAALEIDPRFVGAGEAQNLLKAMAGGRRK